MREEELSNLRCLFSARLANDVLMLPDRMLIVSHMRQP